MSHVNRHLKAAAGNVADIAEDVSHGIASASDAVAGKTRAAGHFVAQSARHVVDAVEEKGEHLGGVAREGFTRGRDRAVRWEHNFEEAVRSRPIASLLIAAGIGAIAGAIGVTLLRRRM